MNTAAPTVLIAEDDPVFRRVLGFTISRAGNNVETASDGLAAYERLCQGGIDFIVTDHQMPVCSGLEMLDRIKANPSIGPIPTILCTAKGFELDSQSLQQQFGLVAIMHKPFSPRLLIELITRNLGGSGTLPPDDVPVAFASARSVIDV
ncbi:MAG: response regulator [Rubripirellula sp.]